MKGSPNLAAHHENWLQCIRSGKQANAEPEIGHLSASLCHLGNIACRLGKQLTFDPAKEQVIGDDESDALVRRKYRPGHWAVPKGV